MRTPKGLTVLLIYSLYLFPPIVKSLRIRNESLSSRGLTASPTLIYRRRLNNGQSKDNIYPQTSPRSQVEQKTDIYPVVNQFVGYSEETVQPKPFISPTSSSNKIPKSLRRNRSRLRSTIAQESVEQEYIPTTKSSKVKTGRRRKVKRPAKIKPIPPIVIDDEVGGENDKTNSTSGGDKNLALEIGSDDGKYALINKFFEAKQSKAPGIISYTPSDDFASDNQYTLGNVKENDIWLSDGHLLVLKGGDLDASLREHWKPIDNYQRGKRPPLRIPLNSDNPPPFPVFVNDSGPPIFLGPLPPFGLPYPPPGAFNETFDPSRFPPPGMIPLYPNGTIPDYFRPPPPRFGGGNTPPLFSGPPGGVYGQGGGQGVYGQGGPSSGGFNGNNSLPPPSQFFPFPPPRNGSSFHPNFLPPPPGFNPNFTGGGPPPGYPLLPPLVLNPNDNETDDPSIFLPPPYDFDYEDDNSSLVLPGPFAPGLVVPPPREFYTVYNKTTNRPTFPPSTGLSSYFGKRPQRPNGKKPKFPITNPPDDSEEAYQPIVTTPYPHHTETPYKKRKQRPGKANKDIFGNKYEIESNTGKKSVIQPVIPLPEQVISQRPFVNIPLIETTIGSTAPPTTKKPLNNYVYVRGQLKSLAEINSNQEEYDYASTPRPPFDERGYPSRVDENEPVILQYHKSKTTDVPAKSFYYNTPKYDAIYNTGLPKKQKVKHTFNYNQDHQNPIIHPSQPPALQQESPVIYINNNNNHLTNQGQNVYNPVNNFQDKITPTYYNRLNLGQPQQQRPQIIELQSPKSYPVTSQRQPHLYNHAGVTQNLNFPTNSVFRPAFGPNSNNQQQSQRSKVLFPGEVNQNSPIYNFRTPLYQQSNRPQVNGYYSPISQYYQPLDQSQVQQPQDNNFYQPPVNTQQRYFGNQNANRPSELTYSKDQDQPYYNGQGRSVGNIQQLSNPYNSQVNQFIPQSQQQTPIRQQDGYVNYREPLPQYNTESEAVTTRTIFKAGPSQAPISGIGDDKDGKSKTALTNDGSYYSFQRGGPGGFSYKIRL